ERVAYAERMVKKGLMTQAQLESDRKRLDAAELALKAAKDEAGKQGALKKELEPILRLKVDKAAKALAVVKLQNSLKDVKATGDDMAAHVLRDLETERTKAIEGNLRQCVLVAPRDGIVLFHIPEQTRFPGTDPLAIVAEGEPVREGQTLMRIDNLDRM